MSLKERIYSVLLVSVSENINNLFDEILPTAGFTPIRIANGVSAAKKMLAERSFDCVIINSPLPDDVGVRLAIDTAVSKNTVVLLLVRAELHDEIYSRVAEHGVFTLPKPTSRTMLQTAATWMKTARELLRSNEKKSLSLDEKMEEIRLVNRAKWHLISDEDMSENEAHKYIEKQAMDRCISKKEVAEEIIRTYSRPF